MPIGVMVDLSYSMLLKVARFPHLFNTLCRVHGTFGMIHVMFKMKEKFII
jgi:hypothetical protein